MEQKKTLIVTGLIILIVLGLLFGGVYYLIRSIQSRQAASNTNIPVASTTPFATTPGALTQTSPSPRGTNTTPGATTAPTNTNPNAYKGPGFEATIPNNWGVLTCTNSQNFELDPYNNAKQSVACDRAVKPVTIIVARSANCQGETVNMGSNRVVRSSSGTKGGEIDYRWCVMGSNTVLDITHRSSPAGSPASSKDDFSTQIEQMISNIKFQ
jgi:hypothetical protein